ncbi:MAG: WG repeat-containing protein [Lachnospiraceae bacterium]|nr:WG repeat-containing protein [Lachnospiraceae bacterium]
MAKKSNIVKKAKGNINLLIIVLLIVSWGCAVISLTSNEEEEAQNALIHQANVYLEDKLYIRAVNNYKSAMSEYTTDNNPQLEIELRDIYLEAGMMEEYYSLLATRVAEGTATEEEYVILTKYYVEEEKYIKALPILQEGIKQFENSEMIQLREQIIYNNSTRTINLPDLRQPSSDWIIPACIDGKWGHVSSTGGTLNDFIYDEITTYSGKYAVVKLNGVYTLIDKSGNWYAVDKVGLDKITDVSGTALVGVKDGKYQIYSRTFKLLCEEAFDNAYLSDNGVYVVQKGDKWAILSAEFEPVTEYIFTDVAVNSKGRVFDGKYAVVNDGSGYCLINADGQPLHEARFVSAKGFEGGLYAVANEQGKWGLANGSGKLIVDYQYGDALSMSSNLAAVEYGGKWGYINRYNTMIIEPEYESVYPFVGNAALAKTEMGTYEVITLKYYDYIK